MAEVWAYHRSHAERHDRYRPQVAEFIEAARNFTDAQGYLAAQMRRSQGTAAWERWFAEHGVDAVLEPTLPILPLQRGLGYERGHPAGPGDPLIALTALWDMTGMPVACAPGQLVGRRLADRAAGDEAALTQVAIDLQEHAPRASRATRSDHEPGRHRRGPRRRARRAARRGGGDRRARSRRRRPARRTSDLDAAGAILIPGLINGHTHAAMTLFRGYGDDLPLMQWLEEKIWPVERRLEADDVYWGTRLACLEMIRSRHRPLLGHVLASRGGGARGRSTPACAPPSPLR